MPLEYTEDLLVNAAGRLVSARRSDGPKPGVSAEQAQVEVETIGRQLATQYPDSNEGVGITAVPLHEAMVGDIRKRSGCCSVRSASCC